MTRKICVALLMAASLAATSAQGEDVTCQEITDPDIQFQAELCSAHVGCKLVFGIHSACTKVKTFLGKLKNLSFGKQAIDSGDVFDAAAPSTEGDESFTKISNSIKASYDKQPQKQVARGVFQNGGKWVYEGPMTNGKRNGTGVLITESGTMFRGDFVDGRQVGTGEAFDETNHKAGAMAGATMDGFGVERKADGTRYEGGYKEGVRNGQGTYKHANGDQYTGNWVDNKKQGQGTYKWPDGNEYSGTWVDGKRQGQGTFKWADGTQYIGNWTDDNMQGQGTKKWPNGAQYTGNWIDDKQQGQGTYIWPDGTRFEGTWQDNKKISGTEISPNGTRVEIANGEAVKSSQQAAAQAKLEEENKAQAERDRLAWEARKRAAQARADKREQARKNEQAEQDAQEAQETSEAIGTLLGAFAQMEQNKADRAQAQYDNQQRVLQAQQEQQRRIQEQQRTAQAQGSKSVQVPKSAPVNECLQIKRDKYNVLVGTNICNFPVQYSYCVVGADRELFACKDPDGSDEGAAGVRAGGTTTFVGSSKGTGVRWMACKGGNGEVLPFLNHKGKRGCY